MQDVRSYLPLLLRGCARLSAALNDLPDVDVRAHYSDHRPGVEKSGKKNTLSFSLVRRLLLSRRVSNAPPAYEWSNWSTAWSTYFYSRLRSLIDSKLSFAFFCDARIWSFHHDIFSFRSVLSTLSRSVLLFFLSYCHSRILRLPTRVSRALSRVRARNETTVRKPLSKF